MWEDILENIIKDMLGLKKKTSKKKIAAVGVTGAVIGASVAAATTRVLTDEKTKKKVVKGVKDAKTKVMVKLQDVKATSSKANKTKAKPATKAKSSPSRTGKAKSAASASA